MPSFKTLIWECFGRLRKFHYLNMLKIRAKISRNYPNYPQVSKVAATGGHLAAAKLQLYREWSHWCTLEKRPILTPSSEETKVWYRPLGKETVAS